MKNYIIAALVLTLVIVILFKGCGKKKIVEETLQQHKYDSLQTEIIRKNDSLIALRIREDQLRRQSDSIMLLISNNEKSRDTLWRYKTRKDSFINSLSVDQLERTISERFGYSK